MAQVYLGSLKEKDLPVLIAEAAKVTGLDQEAKTAKAVFIKPNLTYPVYKPGVTTRREFVAGLVRALVQVNPRLKIYIGEGEGGYNSFSMSEAFKNMGFLELEREFTGVKVVNLSTLPAKEVVLDTPKGPYRIMLPEIFFKEIDFSISCPVPKVHCMTGITLSYKNLWGCLPDTMRLKNHYMFDYIIARISEALKFKFAFLDGKFGLDNNGPMVGDPVQVDWFAAADSLGAFDKVICGLMGFDWARIRHLRQAFRYGLIDGDIRITGEPEALKRKFVLKRTFWNYPALTAFRSRRLTRLFYFSRLAGPLHTIMYTFRRKPIT